MMTGMPFGSRCRVGPAAMTGRSGTVREVLHPRESVAISTIRKIRTAGGISL
jgi:hypothetical protein